jgi:hypothetical protein
LLVKAGIKPGATRARFEAADGYVTSVDLAWIAGPGVLLAYEMNGEPLPAAHGYPLRLLMPGLYGQKNPKWITRIEFVDRVEPGFWEKQGWSDTAEVRTNSHILVPLDGQNVAAPFEVRGVAWAGKRRIAKVEFAVDGAWRPAEILRGPGPLAWTQWYVTLGALNPGRHTFQVRATDDAGFVQGGDGAARVGAAFPDGSAEIHRINVT